MTASRPSLLSPDSWGPFVAEPRAFLVVAPFWLVFSLLGVPGIGSPRVFGVAVIANAVALSACFGLVVVARKTLFAQRERKRVRIPVVLGVGVLVGVAKGLITVSGIALLVPYPEYFDLLPSRILASISVGVLFLPVSAVFLATRERFRKDRELLLRELASTTTSASPEYRQELALVAKDVQSFMERASIELEKRKTEPAELRRYLREGLQRNLRKLTHDLTVDSAQVLTRSATRDIVAITILAGSYPLVTVTLAYIALSAPFVMFQTGLVEGIGRTALSTGLLAGLLWVLRRSPPVRLAATVTLLLSTLTLWSVLNELGAFLAFGMMGSIPFWVTALANITVALAPILLLGAITVATVDPESARNHQNALLSEKYWQRDIWTLHAVREKRAVAQQLHGRLQNVLLATLSRLDKNPDSLDFRDLTQEMTSLAQDLDEISPRSSTEVPSLAEGLDELRHRWGEIIDVDVTTVSLESSLSADTVREILDVAEEGISNAVRHGMATSVSIALETAPTGVSLVARDNGIGPRKGDPGLGTLLFSSLHGATWSLRENELESGSTLTVRWV
jgi:two-component sensor histidine kinase